MASSPESKPSPMLTRLQNVAADVSLPITSMSDRALASSSDPDGEHGKETPTDGFFVSGYNDWMSCEPRPQMIGEQEQFDEQPYDCR